MEDRVYEALTAHKIIPKVNSAQSFKMRKGSVLEMNETKDKCVSDFSADGQQTEDHITNTIRLLRKHAEIDATEKILNKERKEFEKKMIIIEKRNEELTNKVEHLEEFMKKSKIFLQENKYKMNQAMKKVEEEKFNQTRHKENIQILNDQISSLKVNETTLETQIQNYRIYEDFVKKIVDSSEEFTDVNSVVNQNQMLLSALKELTEEEKELNAKTELERSRMSRYTEEKNNELLAYNNQLEKLQTNVDHALNEALKWESKWNHLKSTRTEKLLERSRINMAVRNLFTIIMKQQKLDFHTEDTIEQLEKIQEFITDWKEVAEEVKNEDISKC